MSETDRQKWDTRYREGAYLDRTYPTVLLAEWLDRLPRGRALDIGCGAGRNALHLAEAGYDVTGIDISEVALARAQEGAIARGVEVNWICADLESGDTVGILPDGPFDVIVMIRYVNPDITPGLVSRLGPGGFLVCEEHLESDEKVVGPKNPAFRVKHGELRDAAADLEVRFYREGIVEDPDGRPASLAQLVARQPL